MPDKLNMNQRNKKLLSNTSILAIGQICTKCIMFILTPLLTRWLNQSEFGQLDLILTYTSLCVPIVGCEIGQGVFRFLLDKEENKKEIVASCSIFCLLSSVSVLFLSFIFMLLTSFNKTTILVITLLIIFQIYYSFLSQLSRGLKKLVAFSYSNVIFVCSLTLFVCLFLKILNLKLDGLILSYAISYLLASLYLLFKCQLFDYFKFSYFNLDKIKEVLKYSIPLIPTSVSWWIMNASDRMIVSLFMGATTNAIIAVAHKVPSLCKTLYEVFHKAWLENAVDVININDKNIYYTHIFNGVTKLICTASAIIISLNYYFFTILFSEEYFNGYYIAPIFMVGISMSIMAQFIGSIYIALMQSKKNGITTIYAAIINILLHVFLIRYLGIYAAPISTLVSYIALLVIRYRDINNIMNLEINFEAKISMLFLIYMSISVYIINREFRIFNIFLAMIVFLIINKQLYFEVFNISKSKLIK